MESLTDEVRLSRSETIWRSPENLERLLAKDKSPLIQVQASIKLLKHLHYNSDISSNVFQREMDSQYMKLTSFVEANVENDEQAQDVLHLLLVEPHLDNSTTCCTFACSLKYLYYSAIASTVIALATIIVDKFLPLFKNVPPSVSKALFYALAMAVIVSAHLTRSSSYLNIHRLLALIGAGLLSSAYHYSLQSDDLKPVIFLPDVVAWSALAIHFKSKIMGFIAVAFLLSMARIQSLQILNFTSLLLVGIHIVFHIKLKEQIPPQHRNKYIYYGLFEPGILYLGTLCLLVSLIALSLTSQDPFSWWQWSFYNLLSIIVGGLFFQVGSIFPDIYMFRGIACIFSTLFITYKWFDIDMGNSLYYFQNLGGCVLLLTMLMLLKSRPYLFAPPSAANNASSVELASGVDVETPVPLMHEKEISQECIT